MVALGQFDTATVGGETASVNTGGMAANERIVRLFTANKRRSTPEYARRKAVIHVLNLKGDQSDPVHGASTRRIQASERQ